MGQKILCASLCPLWLCGSGGWVETRNSKSTAAHPTDSRINRTFNVQTFERSNDEPGRPAGCYDQRVIHGKKGTVVLPASNAERTLRRTIEEIPEASSIDLRRSVVYGLGVLGTSLEYRLAKWRLLESRVFPRLGRREGSDRGSAGRL